MHGVNIKYRDTLYSLRLQRFPIRKKHKANVFENRVLRGKMEEAERGV
jgi:hypothetical protein